MSSIRLQWKSAGDRASSYEVWRATGSNSIGAASLLVAGILGNTYTDTTASAGTFYCYWVRAVNPAGTGSFATPSGLILAGATLAAPTNLLATFDAEMALTLTWTASAGATKYDVYRHTADVSASATLIASNVVGTTYEDETVPSPDVPYYYWLRAKDDASGLSAFSRATIGYGAPPTPDAPTGVTATDNLNDEIQITWSASTYAALYNVYRNTTNDSGSATLLFGGVSTTSYTDETPTPGTTYYYWVKAANYTGLSAFSSSDSGIRLIAAPTGVSATDGFADLDITWSAVTGAITYSVWRNTTDDSGSATEIASGIATTSYEDATAVHATTYYYWVKAHGSALTSGFSSSDSGYRTLPTPDAPTGVSATDGLDDITTVTWSASSYADSYSVWREPEAGGGAVEIASGITALTYNDTTGVTGANYYYSVKATNLAGTSGFSSANLGYRLTTVCGATASGGDAGSALVYSATSATLNLRVVFNAYTVADRILIVQGGITRLDTGYVSGTTDVTVGINSDPISVTVFGGTGTGWDYTLTCV